MVPPAGRSAIHGTVTVCIVALRVVAAVLGIASDVLRRISDVMVVGRGAPNVGPNPGPAGPQQLTIP